MGSARRASAAPAFGGDLARRAEPLADFAFLVEDRHGARARPAEAAVDPPHTVLELEDRFRRDRLSSGGRHDRPIVGRDIVLQPV